MSGIVTFDDLVAAQKDLSAADTFDPAFGFLLDLRDAVDIRLTVDEVRNVIAASPVALEAKRAILVGPSNLLGVVRVYEAIRGEQTAIAAVKPCQTVDEAMAWLGVDSDSK